MRKLEVKKLGKLRLSKHTLRNLNESQVEQVAGASGTSGSIFPGPCCFGCGCRPTQEIC